MTTTELKVRYQSGIKVQKRVKQQIKEQLNRVCVKRDCNESLAFERSNRVLCEKHKGTDLSKARSDRPNMKRITKAEQRKLNNEKKQRYYAKHGIKFNKTIRNRTAEVSKTGLEFAGQTLLYENYKEPLKKIEKSKGFGYYGTVGMTSDKEYLQCHICGHLYPHLGAHLRKHKITAEKYKEVYMLSAGTALISEPIRKKLQDKAVKPWDGKLPLHLIEYNRKVQSGEIKHPGSKHRGISLEKRNELGLCPDQLLEKIKELGAKLGHTPSYDEFRREHGGRYIGAIIFAHGSYLNAIKKAKLVSAKELREPSNERLLQDLIDFKEKHGRIPMKSDFSRGLLRSRQIYNRRFGTMNNARIEAGLNAVIPMPFGQIIEVSPDDYLAYKRGEGLSKEAIRKRKARAKRKENYV